MAGSVGSNLAERLVRRGDEVAGIDDLSLGRLENLDGASAQTAPTPRGWRRRG